MADTGFAWYDYLIFIATLVVSLGIGLYFSFAGGKQRTTKEYLMGNRLVSFLHYDCYGYR